MPVTGFVIDGIRVQWSDRHGGVSRPPFDTANLGHSQGDEPEHVAENRRRLAVASGVGASGVGASGVGASGVGASGGGPADPAAWTWLHQVHGAGVVEARPPGEPAGAGSPGSGSPGPGSPRARADAAVVVAPGTVAAVLVADCGPVALAGPGVGAAVHAGWRGVLAGVVGAAAEHLRRAGVPPRHGFIGPCIRPCCYEFGDDDLQPLVARFGPAVVARTRDGRPAFDLPGAIAIALRRAGVTSVEDAEVCTACSPDHFSARRDGLRTGRQALLVERLP